MFVLNWFDVVLYCIESAYDLVLLCDRKFVLELCIAIAVVVSVVQVFRLKYRDCFTSGIK